MLKYPENGSRLYVTVLGAIILFLAAVNFSVANEAKFVYDSKGKRDPFMSLIGKNVTLTDVELLESIEDVRVEGVIIDPNEGSSAIINGQIIKVGEFLGGFRLIKVTKYFVVLQRDEKKHTIQFRAPDENQ